MVPNSHPDKMPAEMITDCNASGILVPNRNSFHCLHFDLGVNNELTQITLTDEEIEAGWAAFQVVNAGGLWELNLSIDEHPMYIYGNSFLKYY